MKKIFILIFFTIFFLFGYKVNAQVNCLPTPAMPVPGIITCGNVNDPCTNKCCVKGNEAKFFIYDIPILGAVYKQLNINNNLIDNIFNMRSIIEIDPCSSGAPSTPGDLNNPGCICIQPTSIPFNKLKKMCADIKDGGEKGRCEACMGSDSEINIWTSAGCVKSNMGSFIQETLLGWGVGIAGGVSMLCIMYAAFMMQTSSGNAEKIKKAQQLMTSCITGLMVIIFSVFILQLIGVKILRIPGFN